MQKKGGFGPFFFCRLIDLLGAFAYICAYQHHTTEETEMTYFVTALTNDAARLIVSETRTTDKIVAEMVAAHLEAQGYVVVRKQEA
jgi:mitochondrial fission protein ELM1